MQPDQFNDLRHEIERKTCCWQAIYPEIWPRRWVAQIKGKISKEKKSLQTYNRRSQEIFLGAKSDWRRRGEWGGVSPNFVVRHPLLIWSTRFSMRQGISRLLPYKHTLEAYGYCIWKVYSVAAVPFRYTPNIYPFYNSIHIMPFRLRDPSLTAPYCAVLCRT